MYEIVSHGKCVKKQELAGQNLTDSGKDLNRFQCLKTTNNARKHSHNTDFRAIGNILGIGALRKQTTVGRSTFVVKNADLALEFKNGPKAEWFSKLYAGIIHQVASRKIVGPV